MNVYRATNSEAREAVWNVIWSGIGQKLDKMVNAASETSIRKTTFSKIDITSRGTHSAICQEITYCIYKIK